MKGFEDQYTQKNQEDNGGNWVFGNGNNGESYGHELASQWI